MAEAEGSRIMQAPGDPMKCSGLRLKEADMSEKWVQKDSKGPREMKWPVLDGGYEAGEKWADISGWS